MGMKSSATVQQMQPFDNSITSSSEQVSIPQPLRMSPSTPRSPNSLMMSAMRLPPAFSSICRINVVLPAPRNPVTTVAGILACMSWLLQGLASGGAAGLSPVEKGIGHDAPDCGLFYVRGHGWQGLCGPFARGFQRTGYGVHGAGP
ncbi:hypothetical protein RV134_260041 [Roseovarius sp. EC-HK134]|nr:hypothetical protein RV134_260041 [Roseovarius sp. EC-HK134]VVT08696.1 hypothetical protein RV420_290257 [Roseovarius sp. EC-SD190]